MLAKAESLNPIGEGSVEDDMADILRTIADKEEMKDEAWVESLLRARDIYHFQSEAVRRVRAFLNG